MPLDNEALIGRRAFLEIGAALTITSLLELAPDYLLGMPKLENLQDHEYPDLRFLESSRSKAPVIDRKTGPYEFAIDAMKNNRLVRTVAKRLCNEMSSSEDQWEPEQVLTRAWELACIVVNKNYPNIGRKDPKFVNLTVLGVVSYALAGIFNPYNTIEDLNEIGVDTQFITDEDVEQLGKYAIWEKFPRILPSDKDYGNPKDNLLYAEGVDTFVHFIGHLTLATIIGRLEEIKSPYLDRMPRILRLGLRFLPGFLQEYVVSIGAGIYWELKETFKKDANGKVQLAGSGFSDPTWEKDMRANKAGAKVGDELLRLCTYSDKIITDISTALDSLTDLKTAPITSS